MPLIFFTAALVETNEAATGRAAGGSSCIVLPAAESAKLPSRGRVPVAGTLNGFAFRGTAFPTATRSHQIVVNRALREGAGISVGDRVTVVLEVETSGRADAPPAPPAPPRKR